MPEAAPGLEEVSLAQGFSTMTKSNQAILTAIQDLNRTLVANIDQASRMDPRGGQPRAAQQAANSFTAGQTTEANMHRADNSEQQGAAGAAGSGGSPPTTAIGRAVQRMHQVYQGLQSSELGQEVSQSRTRYQYEAFGGGAGYGGYVPGAGGGGGGGGGGGMPPGGSPSSGVPYGGFSGPSGPEGGSGMGGSLASAGGGGGRFLGGGLLSGIFSALPGSNVISNLAKDYDAQKQLTNYYRDVEGGSVGNATMERVNEAQYRFQSMGVLNAEESEQAFKGVTRLGYSRSSEQNGQQPGGTTRQDALDYIYNAKKDRGQSVDMGLDQVRVASKSADMSLQALAASLKTVADTASVAGVNTEMAVKQATNLTEIALTRGLGKSAPIVAAAIENQNVSYGKAYQQTTDSSGMFSESQEYRAAAQSGMTQHELRNMMRDDPVKGLAVYDKMNAKTIKNLFPPNELQWIADKIAGIGGPQNLDESNTMDIATEFLKTFKHNDNTTLTIIQELSHQTWQSIEEAMVWAIQNIGGNTTSAQAAKAQGELGATDASGKSKATGQQTAGMETSLSDFDAKAGSNSGFGGGESDTASQYSAARGKTNERSPIIEALLLSDKLQGKAGDEQMVEVKTSKGRMVIPMAEAVAKFPHEIESGMVKFVGKDGAVSGKSVSDVTGVGSLTVDTKSEEGSTVTDGITSTEFNKNNPTAKNTASAAGTNVTIDFTDYAKTWLKAMPPNPADTAAAAGAPQDPASNGAFTWGSVPI